MSTSFIEPCRVALFSFIAALTCSADSSAEDKSPGVTNGLARGSADLCNESGNVKYSARWSDGKVNFTASGKHNTGGFQVSFKQDPAEIFPPQFTLVHKRPAGIVTQAITPFTASTSFSAAEKPKAVTVTDARGRHSIPVD